MTENHRKMNMERKFIQESVSSILKSLPPGVQLVAAAKTRTAEEVQSAIQAGISTIGYNYVQEAERMYQIVGNAVQWHMIGHLQSNKVKKAVRLFDMIETIDSFQVAEAINQLCAMEGKVMPVLIEINSGRESDKTGIFPEAAELLIYQLSTLPYIQVQGLMTLGPWLGNPEDARPYFRMTRNVFDSIKNFSIPNVHIRYLSMGMSNSYRIAIEEGANIIRLGTRIFGERE